MSRGKGKSEATLRWFSSVNVVGEGRPDQPLARLPHGRVGKQHWVYWSSNKRLNTLFRTKANKRLNSLLGTWWWWDDKANKRHNSLFGIHFEIFGKKPTRGSSLFGIYTFEWDHQQEVSSLFGADFDDEKSTEDFTDDILPSIMKMMMIKTQSKQKLLDDSDMTSLFAID